MIDTPTEHAECIALAKWLDRHGVCYTHVPMGGTDAAAGSRARAIGAQRGVPDYLIFDAPPYTNILTTKHGSCSARGVALEMKRRDGTRSRVTKSQEEWLSKLSHRGWVPLVGYGCKHAIEQLEALGYGDA